MKAKKIVLVLTALVLIFSLVGCGANESATQPEQPEQQEAPQEQAAGISDGDYVAYSDADPESKGEAKVSFSIKDGKIAGVKLEEPQDGSKGHAIKDLSTYALEAAVEGEAYFSEKFTGLATAEEIDAVDDFAGITHSSEKYKQAAKRALVKANSEKAGTYFDGTFMGYSDTTVEKGFASAYVTIKDGAVEAVVLQEWQPDAENAGAFTLKDYETYALPDAKPANDFFSTEFVGATGPADIDAVDDFAGVTSSSAKYKEAVKMALEKAQQ